MKLAWSGFIAAHNRVFIFYITVNYFGRTFTENCKIIHEELGPVKSLGDTGVYVLIAAALFIIIIINDKSVTTERKRRRRPTGENNFQIEH